MQPTTAEKDTISKQNVSWWQGFITSIISGVTTLVFLGIFFGGSMQRLTQVEARAEKMELKLEQQNTDFQNKLEVIRQRLERTVEKDDLREIKSDLKDLANRIR